MAFEHSKHSMAIHPLHAQQERGEITVGGHKFFFSSFFFPWPQKTVDL